MRTRPLSAVLAAFFLAGCVQTFPGGVVETRAEASVIADRGCHELDPAPSKPWAAKLNGGTWFLWKRHGGVVVSTAIDAKSGNYADSTTSCVWTPDDG